MTATDATELVDLADPDFVADPYPRLAALRRAAPLMWHSGLGVYLATGHAACAQVLRSRDLGRTFTPRAPEASWSAFNALHADAILEVEPPQHTRLRRLVQGAFSRGHVERLHPRIAELADGLLDGCAEQLAEQGSFDVIASFAEPLPVLVIAELLGWPETERHLLRDWSQAIVKMYEIDRQPDDERRAEEASRAFATYVGDLSEQRAAHPRADLLSDLVAARDQGDRLSASELVATVVLLLNAGHEASVNGFGNGLASMIESDGSPADRATRAGPADADPVRLVEEMLRHDSPLQLFERTAHRDLTIATTTIRRGQRVAALLGAANRDPAVFADPDRFRADRDPNPHLSFGAGIHFCLGAPLGRRELQISVAALRRRWPRLVLEHAVRRPTFVLRGYAELWVRPE